MTITRKSFKIENIWHFHDGFVVVKYYSTSHTPTDINQFKNTITLLFAAECFRYVTNFKNFKNQHIAFSNYCFRCHHLAVNNTNRCVCDLDFDETSQKFLGGNYACGYVLFSATSPRTMPYSLFLGKII